MKNKNFTNDISKGEIIIYENKLDVKLVQNTVWLNLNQIADLFKKDKSVISRHLNSIFDSNELDKKSTVAKNATVQKEGNILKTREIDYYNLDAVLAVGYRTNSFRATQFRKWATNILSKHLIDGYTINENRLKFAEYKYQELKKSIQLFENVITFDVVNSETKGFIKILIDYSKALEILDDFDHQKLSIPKGNEISKFKMTYSEAIKIIEIMKNNFKDSSLFGKEKDNSLKSSIGNIYQTFDDKEVYPTVEEKAAHLLYFITKNHSFIDGNKRIAAAIFICFLDGNGILLKKDGTKRIDENSLVALTLMIATSKPKEKDEMIKIVLNLLK